MSKAKAPWTLEDTLASYKEGWSIFHTDRAKGHSAYELCALDEPDLVSMERTGKPYRGPRFEGERRDFKAAAYVKRRARKGNALAVKAIRFLMVRRSGDVALFGLAAALPGGSDVV
jgi:hypothetical protein